MIAYYWDFLFCFSYIKYLFNKVGLEIIRAKRINTHGGSIRVYAASKGIYKKSDFLKWLNNSYDKESIKSNFKNSTLLDVLINLFLRRE